MIYVGGMLKHSAVVIIVLISDSTYCWIANQLPISSFLRRIDSPIIDVESAPFNSRRIYSVIDLPDNIDNVWKILTAYESLPDVVPWIIQSKVIAEFPNGGAKLNQTGRVQVFLITTCVRCFLL